MEEIIIVWYNFVSINVDTTLSHVSTPTTPIPPRIKRFRNIVDRNNHYLSWKMQRYFANDSPISYNKFGKPLCESCWFNVSHDHQLVVGVQSKYQIGIDCIRLDRKCNLENLKSCFIKDEVPSLELFSKKEAVVKMIGEGLSIDMKRIYCSKSNTIYLDGTKLNVTLYEHTMGDMGEHTMGDMGEHTMGDMGEHTMSSMYYIVIAILSEPSNRVDKVSYKIFD